MKIFHIVLIVGMCALISLGTFFSGAMFSALDYESGETHDAETLQSHETTSSMTYIIAILLIIAAIIAGLRLFRESVN